MGECLISSRNLNTNTSLSNLVQVNIICPKPNNVNNYTKGIVEVSNMYVSAKKYYIDGDSTAITIFIDISTYNSWSFSRYNGEGYAAASTIHLTGMEVGKVYTVDFVAAESGKNDGYVFGIEMDMNADNPEFSCKYLYNATGFTPLNFDSSTGTPNYGSWSSKLISDILGVRPCYLSREDHIATYLNFDDTSLDYEYKQSTTAHAGYVLSPINSMPADVDVMIEFQPRWYKFSVVDNILTFKVATYKVEDDWVQDAFLALDGSNDIKNMYYGMYEGTIDSSGALRSVGNNESFNLPGSSRYNSSIYVSENYMPAGYGVADWQRRCYIIGLLMLITKCRNIQYATHTGNSNFNSMAPIGYLYNAGMFAYNTVNNSIKVLGIENFWGNYPEFCNNIYSRISDDVTEIYLKKHNSVKISTNNAGCPIFTDESTNFESKDVTYNIPRDEKFYIYKIAVNETGSCLLPELIQADPSISFGDSIYINSDCPTGYTVVGMHKDSTDLDIGPLSLYFGNDLGTFTDYAVSNKIAYRLIYCN